MDMLKSLGHPEEIYNLFKFKMGGCRTVMPKLDYVSKAFSENFQNIPQTRYAHMLASQDTQAFRTTA